jgi:hypothetical protein
LDIAEGIMEKLDAYYFYQRLRHLLLVRDILGFGMGLTSTQERMTTSSV